MWAAGVALALGVLAYALLELTPWPAARFYGFFMDRGGERLNAALERHVPRGIAALLEQQYDAGAFLDVYYPESSSQPLPAIVWVHGGAFFSGNKRHVANYLKILAAQGYTAVAVGYSLAPGASYPTALRQVNSALGYLADNAARLRIDSERFVLAGDSAGAQLAAQLANAISEPSYAAAVGIAPAIKRAQLRGVILHCGVFDFGRARRDGLFGHFMRTAMWSYSGRKDATAPPELSVTRFVSADFPPAFISAGNGDPLLPHSRSLAQALEKQGAKVESLFFPDDYQPALPHEYQFNLDTEAGRAALERSLKFLSSAASRAGA
jgi:acetyl esterase/lipase